MKKLNLILGIIIGLLIFSCSSDDDNNNQNSEINIIGIWKLIGGNSSSTGDYQMTACSLMTRLTFNQNSTANFKEHYDNNNDCLVDNYSVDYLIENGNLTFESGGVTNTVSFELTATTLNYSSTENGITETTNWERTQ